MRISGSITADCGCKELSVAPISATARQATNQRKQANCMRVLHTLVARASCPWGFVASASCR
jgi:hypothetical protein